MTLTFLSYGFAFVLGLGLTLRPEALLRASLFSAAFLGVLLLFGAAVWRMLQPFAAENVPPLLTGLACAVLGAALGWRLRRWERRPNHKDPSR